MFIGATFFLLLVFGFKAFAPLLLAVDAVVDASVTGNVAASAFEVGSVCLFFDDFFSAALTVAPDVFAAALTTISLRYCLLDVGLITNLVDFFRVRADLQLFRHV